MNKTTSKAMVLALGTVALGTMVCLAGDMVPHINKRGNNEKAFIEKVANTIVANARTSVKGADTVKYEKKQPKAGRTEFHITATFKTAVLKQTGTANIILLVDTTDEDKWEVLRIDYSDKGFKTLVDYNRKNVEALVGKMNGKK